MMCWASNQRTGGRAVQVTVQGLAWIESCYRLHGARLAIVLLPQYARHAIPALTAKLRLPPASSNSFGVSQLL